MGEVICPLSIVKRAEPISNWSVSNVHFLLHKDISNLLVTHVGSQGVRASGMCKSPWGALPALLSESAGRLFRRQLILRQSAVDLRGVPRWIARLCMQTFVTKWRKASHKPTKDQSSVTAVGYWIQLLASVVRVKTSGRRVWMKCP